MAGQSGFKAGASDPRGITHVGHRDQLADFLQAIDAGPAAAASTAARAASRSRSSARSTSRPGPAGAVRLPLENDADA